MTNEIKEILERHQTWLETNGKDGARANLSRADLSRANLSEANLSRANLSGADLRWADLSGADLRWADLSGADLSGADLRWADLRWADLSGADLSGADLRWADLSGADLSGADLSGANLDYSCFPLWCGGLDVKIDDRQAAQLFYHLVRNVQYSENVTPETKAVLSTESIITLANTFHRARECGLIGENRNGKRD